jgi:hypothetical protein
MARPLPRRPSSASPFPRTRRAATPWTDPRQIDYAAEESEGIYRDPVLFPDRPWIDVFARGADGWVAGWTRTLRDGATADDTAHDLRVLERGPDGRPRRGEGVAYPMSSGPNGRRVAAPTPAGVFFRIRYAGPDDRVGTPEPE